MNPFDLAGPQFLLFYLAFGGCVLLVLNLIRRARESSDSSKVTLTDPYLIAYLRGGKNEALRLGTVSLIDRGLLVVRGFTASLGLAGSRHHHQPDRKGASPEVPGRGRSYFHLQELRTRSCVPAVLGDTHQAGPAAQRGHVRTDRMTRFIIGGAVLFFVAFTKIMIASGARAPQYSVSWC